MKQLAIMIKPASSACNLRCRYCFYEDLSRIRTTSSFGVMKEDVMEGMLETIFREMVPGDRITFAFQGGEPTLAGLPWFRRFVAAVDRWDPGIRVEYALQTNGIVLDEQWCRFLAEHRFLVGLSLDLLPGDHDAVRVDPAGEGTWKRVVSALALLKAHKVEFNVLCTLTNRIARHPREVWKQIVKLDLRYVQFTPCLDRLEAKEKGTYALEPERFAQFYNGIFPLWYQDFRAGRYRSIKLIDDVVNLLAYGRATACGISGRCTGQVIIEADGSVYPCDFYCLDEYRLGNITREPLSVLLEASRTSAFLRRPHRQPALCETCPYGRFCGGGCKRMQRSMCCGPEDSYCGYQDFLNTWGRELQTIALNQRRAGKQG